jgi:hypothetical protein
MDTIAGHCVTLLGPPLRLSDLERSHGRDLLARLAETRAPKTVAAYYDTCRRMLTLTGVSTDGWPSPERPPKRRAGKAGPEEAMAAAIACLRDKGWNDTADLAHVILHAGVRASVEALQAGALGVVERVDAYDTLEVTYRGCSRLVPVLDPEAREILGDAARVVALGALAYRGHIKRMWKAADATGLERDAFGMWALRAAFGRRWLESCGWNEGLVAELLGRAASSGDPSEDLMGA